MTERPNLPDLPEPTAEELPSDYVDPHHRVPDEEWGEVVRNARAFRAAAAPPEQEEDG